MATGSRLANTGNQDGAILIVSLILLMVLTLIGVAGMQSTTMQERMAANTRDTNVAMQAAEAALRDAEEFLDNNLPPTGDFDGSDGLYHFSSSSTRPPDWQDDSAFSDANSREYQGTDLHGISEQPHYFIEELPRVRCAGSSAEAGAPGGGLPRAFRVTALGVGGNENTRSILQSTFRPTC
ncbi:PilX N-terminal domain-containing pilus assembly protein [Aquisalimonas lutea]|uniref:pilus assembly PilX family protein n=1 Tax=Aquisalimonas lutea TaxID=1327750 RepID=UPI0025B394CA|nr:PilX N-terminal domain-containing pilus assembly protein [Aquisalimonas lutea]MDN3517456.1 PilX N-terminal domain-containing pilus assembly protein [Aquisalimonas lutea]